MSFELPSHRRSVQPRVRWLAASFLVEAMLLLFFVMASMAVVTAMFAESVERSEQGTALTDAVALATSAAERFTADPASLEAELAEGGLVASCAVEEQERAGGTMYIATIDVRREGEREKAALYSLRVSKYESGGR